MCSKTKRRQFINTLAIGTGSLLLPGFTYSQKEKAGKFSLVDYHVHLTPDFTIEKAIATSKSRNVKFGIVEHPGNGYMINNDEDLVNYIEMLKPYPVYIGLQPVFPVWKGPFSASLLSELDHIIMDALTIPQKDGSHLRIWRESTQVDDIESFMAMYLDFHDVIFENGIDIFASPTFLPTCIRDKYKEIWTEKRMERIIDLALKNNVAIEINGMYQIPDDRFVKMGLEKGVTFSFGTNGRNPMVAGNLIYCLVMAEKCGLTEDNLLKLPEKDRSK